MIEKGSLFHIGRRDQDAHLRAVGTDRSDQIPELSARQGVHPGRGFIEQQKIGVMDQRRTQTQLLLHPARKFARRPVEERIEPGGPGQPLDAGAPFDPAQCEEFAEELHVLAHRKVVVEVAPQSLRHEGDATAHGRAVARFGHAATKAVHFATLEPLGPGDQAHQRRFAHPVRTDQPDHPAGRKIERQVRESHHLAILVRDAFKPRHWAGRGVHGVPLAGRPRSGGVNPAGQAARVPSGAARRTQATPRTPVLT